MEVERKATPSEDPKPLIRRHVMGHNAKLAGRCVQLRITLTRLTSDYSEGPHCSREPGIVLFSGPRRARSLRTLPIYLSIQSACIMRDRFRVILAGTMPPSKAASYRRGDLTPRSFLIYIRLCSVSPGPGTTAKGKSPGLGFRKYRLVSIPLLTKF